MTRWRDDTRHNRARDSKYLHVVVERAPSFFFEKNEPANKTSEKHAELANEGADLLEKWWGLRRHPTLLT